MAGAPRNRRGKAQPLSPAGGREAYARLAEAVLDQIGLEIIVVDAEGRVRLASQKAVNRMADPARGIGRPLFEAFPLFAPAGGKGAEAVDWKTVIQRHLLSEGRSFEVRDYSIGGRHFDVRGFPLRSGRRQLGGAITLDDVTDRIRLQEELLRQAKTASLANLGASIAHEIRNPLNSIALNIQLLKEDLERGGPPLPEPTRRTIDTTLHGIERLNRIIREFLQFSRPPKAVLKLDDPNGAILSALQLLEGQIRKAGIDVSVNLSPLPRILMDAERLSEAIYNIALNAVQAMEGRPKRALDVASAVVDDQVVIRISDTGPGIPSDRRERLFELFFTTKEGGTGLGLPYAEGIVKAHEGTIQVDSVPGKGTAFSIVLPASILMARSK